MSDHRQHVHFDMTKIEAANDAYRHSLAMQIGKSGVEGVEARLKAAILPALNVAMVQEMNRGVSREELFAGVSSLMTHAIMSYVMSQSGGLNGTPEVRCMLLNVLMMEISEHLVTALEIGNASVVEAVSCEQAGRA